MLVLTRKLDEQILIGDDIKVTLLRVKGNTVRIGIEAPREITVYRHEIWLQVLEENRKALQAQAKAKIDKKGAKYKGKYTKNNKGQQKFGGWTMESLEHFNVLKEEIKKFVQPRMPLQWHRNAWKSCVLSQDC